MKKGIINIIILVLLITNVILTATMAFAIVPAMNSVTSLVKKVAQAIDLQKDASSDSEIIGIDDMETYTFEQKITANLKNGSDNKTHYVSVKITLTLNKRDEGYAKYRNRIAENEERLRGEIVDILGEYTYQNIAANKQEILDTILIEFREFFSNTKFINKVTFSEFIIS